MLNTQSATALQEAARLVNTRPGFHGGQEFPDRLNTPGDVTEQLQRTTPLRLSVAEVETLRQLRSQLALVWSALPESTQDAGHDDDATAEVEPLQRVLDQLIDEHGPLRVQLDLPETTSSAAAPSGQWALGRNGFPSDARQLVRDLVLGVLEAAVAGELDRLKACAAAECENVLVDVTRNRSKQFCDEANCANRTHVRTYRKRLAEDAEGGRRRTRRAKKSSQNASEAPAAAPKDASEVEPAATINRKITRLSARLKDPELSKKQRKKLAKKFKKLRKELKSSADVELLKPAVKK